MSIHFFNNGKPPKHINCDSMPFPPGTKVFLNGILIGETPNMSDNEKIDIHETERIFKLYGVEVLNG